MTHQLGNTEINLKEIVSVSDFVLSDTKTATCFLHTSTTTICATVTATKKELPRDHRINPAFEARLKKELEDFKTKWREAVKK